MARTRSGHFEIPPGAPHLHILYAGLPNIYAISTARGIDWLPLHADYLNLTIIDAQVTHMNIARGFLSAEDVVLGITATGAKGACEEIASFAARRHNLDQELVFRALWRREQIGSTAIGHGIAIPHARIPGIAKPVVLFARASVPIPFAAQDRQPVSVFFIILVPEHAHGEHLRILAAVSEMFSERKFRNLLEVATDPTAIQRLFSQQVNSLAQMME
jgi:PTS system nitrogen regulatory IIA component